MVFYDKNVNPYNKNLIKNNYIGSGATATVYMVEDNRCIKVFYPDDDCYFDEELFNKFKSLPLNSFAKLDMPFYEQGLIKAFTMDYIPSSSTNILNMEVEYTLDNFNNIYKDILTLTNNHIKIEDLMLHNIIIGDNKMMVIDYDRYEISNDKNLLKNNIWWFLYAFRSIYKYSFINEDIPNNTVNNNVIDYLFSNNYSNNEEITKVLRKKLSNVKKPVDLFKRN